MRQFNWALLAITVSLASARQSTWSIHDDLVAYPQVSRRHALPLIGLAVPRAIYI